MPAESRQHPKGSDPAQPLARAYVAGDKADHFFRHHGFLAHHTGESKRANQVPQGPGIIPEALMLEHTQLAQIAPGSRKDRIIQVAYFLSSWPCKNPLNRLVNSIGKIYFVEGLADMTLSVSKYCKVMVCWSIVLATE